MWIADTQQAASYNIGVMKAQYDCHQPASSPVIDVSFCCCSRVCVCVCLQQSKPCPSTSTADLATLLTRKLFFSARVSLEKKRRPSGYKKVSWSFLRAPLVQRTAKELSHLRWRAQMIHGPGKWVVFVGSLQNEPTEGVPNKLRIILRSQERGRGTSTIVKVPAR